MTVSADVKVHPITLSFDDAELERAFREPSKHGFRPLVFTTVAVVGFWLLILPWAAFVVPQYFWLYRTLAIVVLGVELLQLVVIRLLPARLQPMATVIAGAGSTVYNAIAGATQPLVGGDHLALLSCAGLAITVFGAHPSVPLRFLPRTAMTTAIIAGYMIALVVSPASAETAVNNLFWITNAQVFGVYFGYMSERQKRRIFLQRRTIAEERARAEKLLNNMLPEAIAERLKREPAAIADGFDGVTVLFADIVGFTPLSETIAPRELVQLLNSVFSEFDTLTRKHGLEKIKTIGDAYMVVGGVPVPRADHAAAVARMALEMRDRVVHIDPRLSLRIGVHSGPAVAGVIGTIKYAYDLWGDTVNTASRMESHGAANQIHVTQHVRDALDAHFIFEERGEIDVKGKGRMRTWWLKEARA